MSTKLPVINAKALIKILEEKGFNFSRQSGTMQYMPIRMASK